MRIKIMGMIIFISIFIACIPFAVLQIRGDRIGDQFNKFCNIDMGHTMMSITVILVIALIMLLIYPKLKKKKHNQQ